MSLRDLYSKIDLRDQVLAAPVVGPVESAERACHGANPWSEGAEQISPALVLVLSPLLGAGLWGALIYILQMAF